MSEFADLRNKYGSENVEAFFIFILGLNIDKITYIQSFYGPDWLIGVYESFSKVDNKRLGFVKKCKSLNMGEIPSRIDKFCKNNESEGVEILFYTNSKYPENLKRVSDYPLVLYCIGDVSILEDVDKMVTVVGSRLYTKYSEMVLDKVLSKACGSGAGIVSGLALGIDGIGHKIAVESKAKTIAVIGGGVDYDSFYPKNNWKLKNDIIDSGGLVVSEYPPGIKPNKWHFPARNRILAGLTGITWVVQAGLKSGTLITAQQALDIGSEVVTTPNNIFEKGFDGNTKFIKNGAGIVTDGEDILHMLGMEVVEKDNKNTALSECSDEENAVYRCLSDSDSVQFEEICDMANLSEAEISSCLTMLELKGLVENIGENCWIKKS